MPPGNRDKSWVGFDLGGTKMLSIVYDAQFQALGRKRQKTRGFEGEKAGVERIAVTIAKSLERAGVSPADVAGIGLGCPGPLDLQNGVILEAPNLGWERVAVKERLSKEFGCPIVIANDVDAGVYGENRFGAARSARCVLGVFPGTGIGGGCVYDGRILHGRTSSCMEIGHVQVIPDGPLCGCGLRGCLEAVAGRLAIAGQAAQAVYRGQAPKLREIAGSDVAEIRSGMLQQAIDAGDKVIERIVRDACGHIGTVVAGFVHLLAPDYVVLGGGMVEAMPKLFVEAVEATARKKVLPSFTKSFKVVPAELGDDAVAIGAAAWARELITGGVRD